MSQIPPKKIVTKKEITKEKISSIRLLSLNSSLLDQKDPPKKDRIILIEHNITININWYSFLN